MRPSQHDTYRVLPPTFEEMPAAVWFLLLQIIRLIDKREPKATALIFKTGKVVVTGARSNLSVDYACNKFAAILGKLGNDTSSFKCVNYLYPCSARPDPSLTSVVSDRLTYVARR